MASVFPAWPRSIANSPLTSPARTRCRAAGSIALAAIFLATALSARAEDWPFPPHPGATATVSTAAAPPSTEGAPAREIPLIEKPFAQLSDQHLDEWGQKALALNPEKWKHAETDNFILHYRRVTEAQKVAREVEYDLWFVAASLGATRDQYRKKSHIFVFQDDKEWTAFLAQTTVPQWASSYAWGDELFLNIRNTDSYGPAFDSHTLAHETTHAVVARLYPNHRWPLWLNEGFAEYMGAASVAARKGQTVKRNEHTLRFASMSLEQMQALQAYPDDPVQVSQLYETAEKLVRFIMTELPKDRFVRFAEAVNGGMKLPEALQDVYADKISDYDTFKRRFDHFSK